MGMHTQEWALVWLNVGLLGFAFWFATRSTRPGPLDHRLVAAAIGFGSVGFLFSNLPRLLNWPRGIALALSTIAFLPFIAALVTAIRLWQQYTTVRRTIRRR